MDERSGPFRNVNITRHSKVHDLTKSKLTPKQYQELRLVTPLVASYANPRKWSLINFQKSNMDDILEKWQRKSTGQVSMPGMLQNYMNTPFGVSGTGVSNTKSAGSFNIGSKFLKYRGGNGSEMSSDAKSGISSNSSNTHASSSSQLSCQAHIVDKPTVDIDLNYLKAFDSCGYFSTGGVSGQPVSFSSHALNRYSSDCNLKSMTLQKRTNINICRSSTNLNTERTNNDTGFVRSKTFAAKETNIKPVAKSKSKSNSDMFSKSVDDNQFSMLKYETLTPNKGFTTPKIVQNLRVGDLKRDLISPLRSRSIATQTPSDCQNNTDSPFGFPPLERGMIARCSPMPPATPRGTPCDIRSMRGSSMSMHRDVVGKRQNSAKGLGLGAYSDSTRNSPGLGLGPFGDGNRQSPVKLVTVRVPSVELDYGNHQDMNWGTTVEERPAPRISHQLTEGQIKVIKDRFNMEDQNQDGKLSETQLKTACEKFGLPITDKAVASMLRDIQRDKHGHVTYEDFEEMIAHFIVKANEVNRQQMARQGLDEHGALL